jgi:hypothetical protein
MISLNIIIYHLKKVRGKEHTDAFIEKVSYNCLKNGSTETDDHATGDMQAYGVI